MAPDARSASVTWPASARAVSRNMASVTRRTCPTHKTNPTPVNTNALLPCPTRYVRPRYATGSNGLPVAMIARPSDQQERVHDRALVDRGHRADDRLGKDTGGAGGANENRRLEIADRLLQRDVRSIATRVRGHLVDRSRVGRLELLHVRAVPRHEAAAVDGGDPRSRLVERQPLIAHRRHEQRGDPLRGGAGPAN